ncbi:MAG: hypothetical protein ABIE22_03115 [archaeon]
MGLADRLISAVRLKEAQDPEVDFTDIFCAISKAFKHTPGAETLQVYLPH